MPHEIVKLHALEVVKDIRDGLDNSALMEKYHLNTAQV